MLTGLPTFRRFALRLLPALLPGTVPIPGARADDLPAAVAARGWIAPVLPGVVSIATVKFVDDHPGQVPPRRINGFGSGFIVHPDGTWSPTGM